MVYVKNLPGWERMIRFAAALGLAICAWRFQAGPGGVIFGVMAVMAALTAVFGFCPMCALAGRRIATRRENA